MTEACISQQQQAEQQAIAPVHNQSMSILAGERKETAFLWGFEYFRWTTCNLCSAAPACKFPSSLAQSLFQQTKDLESHSHNRFYNISWKKKCLHQLRLREASMKFQCIVPERGFVQCAPCCIDCSSRHHWGAVYDCGIVHQTKLSHEEHHMLHLLFYRKKTRIRIINTFHNQFWKKWIVLFIYLLIRQGCLYEANKENIRRRDS